MRKNEKENSSATARGEEKYTLITNIREVGYSNIRIFCNAVLLSEGSIGLFEPTWTIRGFGTEAAWDNFMIHLSKESFPYTLTPFENKSFQMLHDDGSLESLFTGNILRFQDGSEFNLSTNDSKRPIDVHVQHGDICKVWEILQEKVVEYWTAPYMPHLQHHSAAGLRALSKASEIFKQMS